MKSYRGWSFKPVGYHVEAYKKGRVIKAHNKHELIQKIHEAEREAEKEKEQAFRDYHCSFCGKKMTRAEQECAIYTSSGTGRRIYICPECYKENYQT